MDDYIRLLNLKFNQIYEDELQVGFLKGLSTLNARVRAFSIAETHINKTV
ncbi:MAG: hypothetical protein KAS32_01655 [Candidatus Peribacteraceae bacterium]|nr:hypothetical protein [Candidatus Peribacteraceae bacterium]